MSRVACGVCGRSSAGNMCAHRPRGFARWSVPVVAALTAPVSELSSRRRAGRSRSRSVESRVAPGGVGVVHGPSCSATVYNFVVFSRNSCNGTCPPLSPWPRCARRRHSQQTSIWLCVRRLAHAGPEVSYLNGSARARPRPHVACAISSTLCSQSRGQHQRRRRRRRPRSRGRRRLSWRARRSPASAATRPPLPLPSPGR